jgi:hypothetical protein
MNTVHGMIAFLRAEADLAEARAKQLRLTAALIQSNQQLPSTEQRTYRIACVFLEYQVGDVALGSRDLSPSY